MHLVVVAVLLGPWVQLMSREVQVKNLAILSTRLYSFLVEPCFPMYTHYIAVVLDKYT